MAAPLAAVPTAALNVPTSLFIGENFSVSVTFDNAAATDVGYGPFIDLVFPVIGIDGAGAAVDDGIDFVNATYLGQTVTATQLTFPNDGFGCVAHPYAVDALINPLQVCSTPGNKLVVLQLPFGSFTADQPPATVMVNATLSNLADLGAPLSITARAGFQYGNDPLDNPAGDPSLVGTQTSAAVTPKLVEIKKSYSGPEDETATGPNFPRQWIVTVDVAPGQTITTLDVTDLLPNNVAYLGVTGISPTGSAITQPAVGTPSNPPNNKVVVQYPSVTGATSSADAVFAVNFFVPRTNANGNAVIDPLSGDDVLSVNQADALGDWTPLDTRDLGGIDNASAGPAQHTVTDKSIAIQKAVSIVADVGGAGATPGDTLEYTLNFQVSDFFAFQSIVISDTFSDGQRWLASFTPTLSVTEHGITASGPMASANYTVTLHSPGTGATDVLFDVSSQQAPLGQDVKLLGGCVPAGGTGGSAPDCATYNSGATTGLLKFRTVIQEDFSDAYPSGDASVDQGDVLNNAVTIEGDLLSVANLTPNGQSEADGSGASITIVSGNLVKTVYAINGVVCSPQPCTNVRIAPADLLTYRLKYDMPSGDIENLRFSDYLPLPVFFATEVIPPFATTASATPPPAGAAKFGPADTFHALSAITPAITTNGVANSIKFDFGTYDNVDDSPRTIDILFTVTASAEPFADGLFLTNQVRIEHGTTNAGAVVIDAIIQIQLTEPKLNLRKGVIAIYNEDGTLKTGGVFTPSTKLPAGVTVNAPATCTRVAGAVHSSNLGTTFNSNLSNADHGDRVTYAIVVENTGGGVRGAYDVTITDTLPSGIVVADVSNLCAQTGAGAVLSYTGSLSDLFGANGIRLTDPANVTPPPATLGSLGPGQDASGVLLDGKNIAIITYDVILPGGAEPARNLDNTAAITNYAGSEGGENFVTAGATFNGILFDAARVTIASPALSKVIANTNQSHTSNLNVALGEIISYTVTITVPEGTSNNVTVVDALDAGLAYVDCVSVTASAGIISSIGSFANACNGPTNPTIINNGRTITHNLGVVTNSNANNAIADTITLVYKVVALNSAANVRGAQLDNNAVWNWSLGSISASAPNVIVVEPTLQVSKAATPTVVDAGDVVTFTLTIQHTLASNADTFDAILTDVIPAGFTYVAGSLTNAAGLAPSSAVESTGTITVTWANFSLGQTSTMRFRATLNSGAPLGQTITNTANLRWTSLPGAITTAQSPYDALSTERTGNISDPGGSANTYAASGQVQITVDTPQLTKSLVATSESHTGAVSGTERVAIGEIIRYRLVVRLPESSATNLQLRDRLPSGLLFLDDSTAKVAFVANESGITSTTINSSLNDCTNLNVTGNSGNVVPTCPLPDAAVSRNASSDDDAYVSGDDPFFKLDNVVNTDSDVDGEFIVIEFNALVENITGNQAFNNNNGAASSTTRSNDFQLTVAGNTLATSNSISARIAEPVVRNLSKSITTTPSDAGDTIVYHLTYGNTASGSDAVAAFNIVLVDVLNANLSFQNISGSTTGGACGGTASSFSSVSAGQTITATVTCLNPGGTATIDITAKVISSAPVGATIPNTANLTYTSLPGTGTAGNPTGSNTPGGSGAATGERNGANGVGGLNDYVSASNISTTLATPTVTKLAPSPTQYTIGDVITYTLRATLPEGVTQNLRLVDVLPAGLGYVDHEVITMAATSGGLLAADYNGLLGAPTCPACTAGATGTLTFIFGNTQTNGSGPVGGTSNNHFLLRVAARVLSVIGNQQGTTLQNTASLMYDDPTLGANRAVSGGAQTITVIEPRITATKSVLPTGNVQAGDTLNYLFVLTNSGNSPAYDVNALDTLAQGVAFATLGTCTLTPGTIVLPSTAAPSGNTITFDGNPAGSWDIPIGGAITCTYTATALNTLYVNGYHTNTIDADWSSQNGATGVERIYDDTPGITVDGAQDTATAAFMVNAPTFSKSDGGVLSATIGDTVHYTLTIASPLGTIRNLVVQDVMPAGLIYNGDQAIAGISTAPIFTASAPNNGSAAVTLTWSFGNAVITNNTATMTFSATIANVIGNQRTNARNNVAALNHEDADGVAQAALNGADSLTLIEPVLALSKIISTPATPADAGGLITYRIVIDHATVSSADAADVVVTDALPASLINPSIINIAGVNTSPPTGEITGGVLRVPAAVDGTFDLPLNASVIVTYQAELDPSVTPNQAIANMADVVWSSQNGASAQERAAGNGLLDAGGLNDYELQHAASFTTNGYTLSKALLSTSAAHTADPQVAIGEIITYTLAIILPEGTAPSLRIIDLLPPGLGYVGGSAVVDASGFGGVLPAPVITPAEDGSSGQDVQFDFGPITTTGDNNPNNNGFVIRLRARVLDIPANVGLNPTPTMLPNAATVQAGTGSTVSSNTVTVEVVEPHMVVAKTIAPSQAAANDVVTVTLVVQNTGLADAFEVVLSDALPTGLTFDDGLTHVLGLAPTSLAEVAGVITAGWSNFPDGGASTVRFQAKLAANVVANQVLTNEAFINQATTLPGSDAAERDEPDTSDSDTVLGIAPDITLTKDDGQTTTAPGQTIIYELVVSNLGQRAASGVVISDTVPANTTFDAGASSFGWSCSDGAPAGMVCSFTVGALAPLSSLSLDFVVVVDHPLSTSVLNITNVAEAHDDGAHGADPNPGNNADDDSDSVLVTTIGDRVWHDRNGDGLQTPGEPGLANAEVRLYRNGDVAPFLTTSTNASGVYTFTNLAPGAYFVEFVLPSGYAFTWPDVNANGNDGSDSDANPVSGRTDVITLAAGATNATLDAGLYLPVTIGNFIFLDPNGNGVQNPGETIGVSGIPITVTNLATANVYTAVSVAGNYLHSSLPPGVYRVEAPAASPGLVRTSPSPIVITLVSGDVYLVADFGYISPTAVLVTSFTAQDAPDGVWVRWRTWGEDDLEGFVIWRSAKSDSGYAPVSPLIPASNYHEGASHDWLDTGANQGVGYWYQLEMRPDGVFFGPIPSLSAAPKCIFLPRLAR